MKVRMLVGALIAVAILGLALETSGQSRQLPADVTASLILKLLPMESGFASRTGKVTIFVIGDDELAKALEQSIGKPIGKCSLEKVVSSEELPSKRPDCIYVGDVSMVDTILAYTRSERVLSVTAIEELASKGVALTLALGADGKPEIFLNLGASAKEGLAWTRAILKIAKMVS